MFEKIKNIVERIVENVEIAIGDSIAYVGKGLIKVGNLGDRLLLPSKKIRAKHVRKVMLSAGGKPRKEAFKIIKEGGLTKEEIEEGTPEL